MQSRRICSWRLEWVQSSCPSKEQRSIGERLQWRGGNIVDGIRGMGLALSLMDVCHRQLEVLLVLRQVRCSFSAASQTILLCLEGLGLETLGEALGLFLVFLPAQDLSCQSGSSSTSAQHHSMIFSHQSLAAIVPCQVQQNLPVLKAFSLRDMVCDKSATLREEETCPPHHHHRPRRQGMEAGSLSWRRPEAMGMTSWSRVEALCFDRSEVADC
jgi:hypothetical protein